MASGKKQYLIVLLLNIIKLTFDETEDSRSKDRLVPTIRSTG